MKQYLSHGMGVNSTALMLLLEDEGIEFESIFVNHGGDYPETYQYLTYLQNCGFEITEILPNVEGSYSSLYDFCFDKKIIPFRRFRWCTEKFKVIPFLNYIETPCICYLGFDIGEKKRAFSRKAKRKKERDVIYKYPLIDAKMNRKDCVNLIQTSGLKTPPKSGCFFCPFMRREEIRAMYLHHCDLYEKAKLLELNCRERNGDRFLRDRPFEINGMEHIPPLTSWLK